MTMISFRRIMVIFLWSLLYFLSCMISILYDVLLLTYCQDYYRLHCLPCKDIYIWYRLKNLCVTLVVIPLWFSWDHIWHFIIMCILYNCVYSVCPLPFLLLLHAICVYCVVGPWLHVANVICWIKPNSNSKFALYYLTLNGLYILRIVPSIK